jgi:ATP-dependent DNA ligase
VAKRHDLHYEHGVRAMVKVKRQRTMDCVVGGFRVFAGRPAVSSLLLGLYRDAVLEHIGIAASFTERQRREFLVTLWPIATQLAGHPWAGGYGARGPVARLRGAASSWQPELPLDWIPVRPQLVAEVDYDHLERGRLRHPARFRRWRPDRTPQSCTFDQIPGPLAA